MWGIYRHVYVKKTHAFRCTHEYDYTGVIRKGLEDFEDPFPNFISVDEILNNNNVIREAV